MSVTKAAIRKSITEFAHERGEDKTFCPSEVARALADDWRPLMDEVRAVAAEEASAGRIVVTQKGRQVDIATVVGPIRLGLGKPK